MNDYKIIELRPTIKNSLNCFNKYGKYTVHIDHKTSTKLSTRIMRVIRVGLA